MVSGSYHIRFPGNIKYSLWSSYIYFTHIATLRYFLLSLSFHYRHANIKKIRILITSVCKDIHVLQEWISDTQVIVANISCTYPFNGASTLSSGLWYLLPMRCNETQRWWQRKWSEIMKYTKAWSHWKNNCQLITTICSQKSLFQISKQQILCNATNTFE